MSVTRVVQRIQKPATPSFVGMQSAGGPQMHAHVMMGLVTLIALGAAGQLVAYHARMPSILVLLVLGFLAGPVLGFLSPDEILGDLTFPVVSLGAAVILFEGGITAHFEGLRPIRSTVGRLTSLGLLITWVLTSGLAYWFLGLSPGLSILLGAILVVTGPTVIGPLLLHCRPGGSVGRVLKYEGIINDALGAVLALIVFQVIQVKSVESAASLIVWGVVRASVAATLLGLVGSFVYAQGRKRGWIPAVLENAVLLPLVLAIFMLSNKVQPEAGLLSVTVMGMALASRKDIDVSANVEFAEHLRTLLISVLFILLTARMSLLDLSGLPWGGIGFVALLILVVRPAAVFLSTWGTSLPLREKAFLAVMAPRGIVAAAVASVFALRLSEDGFEGAQLLLSMTFVVIATCVVVYGLGARPLVSLLKLKQEEPQGVLLLGDNHLSRKIADGLKKSGRDPVLVSHDRRRVLRSRLRGFSAEYGDVQSAALLNRLDIESIGCMLALTPNDDKNTLGCVHFGRTLGKKQVGQVTFSPTEREADTAEVGLRGRVIAAEHGYDDLLSWSERADPKITPITEEFTFDKFREFYGKRALPLLALSAHHAPRILVAGEPPKPGEDVLSLIQRDVPEKVVTV